MPDAPRSVPRRHATYASRGGGTSVASSRRGPLLIAAGAFAAVAVALVIWLLVRDGGEVQESADLVQEVAEAADPDPGAERASASSSLPPPSPAFAEPEPSLDDVVSTLSAELRRQRMWATVSIDRAERSVIVIQSSLCEDQTLVGIVAEARANAAQRGVTAIRCVAKHGATVFEEAL